MAITSEIVGRLNLPGYKFINRSPATYEIPPMPRGMAVASIRWGGSNDISVDMLNKESGEKLFEFRSSNYAQELSWSANDLGGAIKNGVLMRFNNNTPIMACVIPNSNSTPPQREGV